MSWGDSINAAIVCRISGKAALIADEHGVEQVGQRLVYADLQRRRLSPRERLSGGSGDGRAAAGPPLRETAVKDAV